MESGHQIQFINSGIYQGEYLILFSLINNISNLIFKLYLSLNNFNVQAINVILEIIQIEINVLLA